VEVRDQALNDFLTELLLATQPEVTSAWTGGVAGSVAGKRFSLWFESQDKIRFTNFREEANATSVGSDNAVGGGR
jgi:hypothetical protein